MRAPITVFELLKPDKRGGTLRAADAGRRFGRELDGFDLATPEQPTAWTGSNNPRVVQSWN
jgi:hypothetical protein